MMACSRYVLIASLLFFLGCSDSVISSSDTSPEYSIAGSSELTPADNRSDRGVLNFTAPMDPGQEVHEVNSNATGVAIFQHRVGSEEIRFRLNVANIEDITMAHIHKGARGVNGPPIVWLYPESPPPDLIPGRTQGTLVTGVITSADLVSDLEGEELDELIALMQAGETYVNVHTDEYGAGEIRGQIEHGSGMVP